MGIYVRFWVSGLSILSYVYANICLYMSLVSLCVLFLSSTMAFVSPYVNIFSYGSRPTISFGLLDVFSYILCCLIVCRHLFLWVFSHYKFRSTSLFHRMSMSFLTGILSLGLRLL